MTVTGEPIVAVVGKFQEGKSSLINALLGDRYAQTGSGLRTTATGKSSALRWQALPADAVRCCRRRYARVTSSVSPTGIWK